MVAKNHCTHEHSSEDEPSRPEKRKSCDTRAHVLHPIGLAEEETVKNGQLTMPAKNQ